MEYVFLTEERSMKIFLEKILITSRPQLKYRIFSHEGKSDLRKSISHKLKVHCKDNTTVVILIDQDSYSECRKLKSDIVEIGLSSGKTNFKVRIVCHELESWYLGDLGAVDAAFGTKLAQQQKNRKYRQPDRWQIQSRY